MIALRPYQLDSVARIIAAIDPLVVAPTGSNRAFHPDAEIAVAKAARLGNHLQILSTVATTSIEDAIAARGAPVWFQLYTTQKWEVAEALVKRAESAGAPVIAVTPIVGGKALKGSAGKIMGELGHEASARRVALEYRTLIGDILEGGLKRLREKRREAREAAEARQSGERPAVDPRQTELPRLVGAQAAAGGEAE